uniref:Avena alpha amylase trypsin inhibitor n=1 Tax=Avena strigosa TaxID=38783 RepID=A0A1B2LQB6_9POAL|nr:avena alpha amylase trypsin inhibitor [Avena strigosa]
MASNCRLLLLAALLVSVFAAAAATSGGEYCYPSMGLPSRPLYGCREYVAQQTCGPRILGAPSAPIETLMERCCLEFSQIQQHCRCQAVRYLMGSRPERSSLMNLPGCPIEAQRDFARILPTPRQCNLVTDYNTRYCLDMDKFM